MKLEDKRALLNCQRDVPRVIDAESARAVAVVNAANAELESMISDSLEARGVPCFDVFSHTLRSRERAKKRNGRLSATVLEQTVNASILSRQVRTSSILQMSGYEQPEDEDDDTSPGEPGWRRPLVSAPDVLPAIPASSKAHQAHRDRRDKRAVDVFAQSVSPLQRENAFAAPSAPAAAPAARANLGQLALDCLANPKAALTPGPDVRLLPSRGGRVPLLARLGKPQPRDCHASFKLGRTNYASLLEQQRQINNSTAESDARKYAFAAPSAPAAAPGRANLGQLARDCLANPKAALTPGPDVRLLPSRGGRVPLLARLGKPQPRDCHASFKLGRTNYASLLEQQRQINNSTAESDAVYRDLIDKFLAYQERLLDTMPEQCICLQVGGGRRCWQQRQINNRTAESDAVFGY
eukprot:gene11613-17905_t